MDDLPADEAGWDSLRAFFDDVGQTALEAAIESGVPPEVAGQRIAHFNDILIETLKKKV